MKHGLTTAAGILVIFASLFGCGFLVFKMGAELSTEKLAFVVTMLTTGVGAGFGLIAAADGRNVQPPSAGAALVAAVAQVAQVAQPAPAAAPAQPPAPSTPST